MPKQEKHTKLEAIKLFFWDPTSRKCMGRTGDSWLKIIAFYIALYTVLAAVWASFFFMFQQTISDRYPKWTLDASLIGTNPGLGFRPQNPPSRIDSALISYKVGPDGDSDYWVENLQSFVGNNSKTHPDGIINSSSEPKVDSFYPFDTSSIPPKCTHAQKFSFDVGTPCILIKINRIYGWQPKPLEKRPNNYPRDAPFRASPNHIQITCEGQNDFDKEHIGDLEYFPSEIQTKYYPFYNQYGYQSPYVMVHFKNPRRNTLIFVECKAWAQNIEHERFNRRGMTSFELFIEDPTKS